MHLSSSFFFFFNDTATTEIYTLSLHDALPIYEDAVSVYHTHEVFERANVGAADRRVVLGPEVERQHLVPRLVAHAAHTRRQPIHAQVVENDELAVPRELAVHVDAVHAGAEGALHGVQAVVEPLVAE